MKKIGVIFGGMSTENEVSVVSGKNILENLNKDKYDIYPIYISKQGDWYKYLGKYSELQMEEQPKNISKIENVFEYIKQFDIVFPVLHGLYGEDGTIQGLFELLQVPYVGCKVLASSVGMDKVYSKIIFEKAGIKQTKSCYIKSINNEFIYVDEKFNEVRLSINELAKKIEEKLKYPMFVKPSNSGSSVGVSKASNIEELESAIMEAKKFDRKILVEQGIVGREIECAVLENDVIIAGEVGEIKPADDFYSYDAKYNNENSETVVPANLPEDIKESIRKIAIKAFKAIDGSGLARIDFFVENNSEEIYLNEINTMPGFTQISMYPKLMEAFGIQYKDLLDKLIESCDHL